MKKITSTIFSIVLIVFLFTSCKKEDNTSNNNNTSITPVAAVGTIIYNGKVYPIKNNLGWTKRTGAYLQTFDASTADSTVALALMFTDSLPAANKYNMGNNIIPMPAGKYGFSINFASKTTFMGFYHVSLEGKGGADVTVVKNATNRQYIGNNLQAFKPDLSNANLLSFNIIVND